MGTYDNVEFEMNCPECGTNVNDFQSKDGFCILATVKYWEVDNFYSACPSCGLWIEFTRKIPKEELPISAYQMTVSHDYQKAKK